MVRCVYEPKIIKGIIRVFIQLKSFSPKITCHIFIGLLEIILSCINIAKKAVRVCLLCYDLELSRTDPVFS